MNLKTLHPIIATLAAAALFTSCAGVPSGGDLALGAHREYDLPAKLPGNPNNVRVKVSLSRQRTYVMEGSEILLAMPVSVGAPHSRTPLGSFRISGKEEKRRSTTHGFAYHGASVRKTTLSRRPPGWSFKGTPMPYWCEFMPDYGFHTGWVKHHPCTDGCIRIHENLAPKFFQIVQVGTPVSIAYSQAEDATHGSIPLPPDAGPIPDYPPSFYLGDGYFKQHKTPDFH